MVHSEQVKEGVATLHASCDVMASLIDSHRAPEFAPVTPERYFDVLVCSIVGQQLSVRAADTIESRLRALVGELTPDGFTPVDDEQLRAVGLSRSKVTYIRGLQEAFGSGLIDPHHLSEAAEPEVASQLTALKGIGPWTAEMFMIFGLGKLDVWSPGDLGLRRTVEHFFGEYRDEIAERWRPYRSIAAWYLWEHSDTLMGRAR